MFEAAFHGYIVAVSLIMAIGAQNAFVLRQGIRREYVGTVVLVCAGSDAILIAAGVAGFGAISDRLPMLGEVMRWGGVAFLLVYGALRFQAALRGGEALKPGAVAAPSRAAVLTTVLMLTWANPHVYLDTVVLLGSISAQYAPHLLAFGGAAILGSVSFFTLLGYGARYLAPAFANPRAWVVLEVIVGVMMWSVAAALAINA